MFLPQKQPEHSWTVFLIQHPDCAQQEKQCTQNEPTTHQRHVLECWRNKAAH